MNEEKIKEWLKSIKMHNFGVKPSVKIESNGDFWNVILSYHIDKKLLEEVYEDYQGEFKKCEKV